MNKKTINLIALRYFTSRKRVGLISFTSMISILGIGIGSFALIVTMSILNGFEREVAERVIDVDSHLKIYGRDIDLGKVEAVKDFFKGRKFFKSLYPYVYSKAIISANGIESVVRVKAVDESALKDIFVRKSSIVRGSSSFRCYTSDLPGIILGYRLADKLGLYVGDTLYVMNPFSIKGLYSMPRVEKFVLSGVFELEIFDYDDNLAFIGIEEGQKLFGRKDSYDGIEIKLTSYKLVKEVKNELVNSKVIDANVSTWDEMHKVLFGAMKLEKYGSLIALLLIILVAVFNLTSTIVMLIVEKVKEIGILRAMGATSKAISEIFVRLGLLNGVIGLTLGVLFSTVLCLAQQHYRFIPLPSVYYIPYLPVVVRVVDVAVIFVLGLLLILLGAFYPSKKMSKMETIKAINYEK